MGGRVRGWKDQEWQSTNELLVQPSALSFTCMDVALNPALALGIVLEVMGSSS